MTPKSLTRMTFLKIGDKTDRRHWQKLQAYEAAQMKWHSIITIFVTRNKNSHKGQLISEGNFGVLDSSNKKMSISTLAF